MLKSTVKYGLGVLLVLAPLLAAVYGIATGDFFFDSEGRGLALLIILGFGVFTGLSFYTATRMKAFDANGEVKEATVARDSQSKNANTAKKGFVHP